MATTPSRLAEKLFERYLDEQGYCWRYEANLNITAKPDYLIDANGYKMVCEVKAFGVQAPIGPAGSRSMKEMLRPHRNDVREAAHQLRELSDRGWPLIVVLSNPTRQLVQLDPKIVMSAMYGDLVGSAQVLKDGSLGDFVFRAERNGKLRNDHQYISAVAILRCRSHAEPWSKDWIERSRPKYPDTVSLAAAFMKASVDAPDGDDVFLEVIETISETAVPLSREIFNGPNDRRWGPNTSRTALVKIR